MARQELVKCAKCLTRHLPHLDRHKSELVALERKQPIERKETLLNVSRNRWRALPVVASFLKEHAVVSDRKRFLVITGPSRTGKTQYALSLFGKAATYEATSAGTEDPPWQDFDDRRHRAILFDEATTVMLLQHRKLFQAPNAVVTLGQSRTNCHAFDVYVNNAVLIITSNSWLEQLSMSPLPDAEWLKANQVLVQALLPLWEDDDGGVDMFQM